MGRWKYHVAPTRNCKHCGEWFTLKRRDGGGYTHNVYPLLDARIA